MSYIVSALGLERERQLMKLFPEPVRFSLLYKGSHHGFNLDTMRSKIDYKNRMVFLVYPKAGSVKGGCMSSYSSLFPNKDSDSFLFEIDHREATLFPVTGDSSGITWPKDNLSFGECLRIYRGKARLSVEIGSAVVADQPIYKTGWTHVNEAPYVDVEVLSVEDIGKILPTPWRTQTWAEEERGILREKVVSFQPVCSSLGRVRALLLGPTGSGKTSLVNSVRSVLYGRVMLLPFTGTATTNVKKKLKSSNIWSERGGKATALTLVEVPSVGDEETPGLTLQDTLAVINGKVPEGHKFSGDVPTETKSSSLMSSQMMDNKIHCAVFVLNACHVTTPNEGLKESLRTLQAEIADMDIPQVVLLTHVDQVCHAVQQDIRHVYNSPIVQQKMQQAAELVGLPMSYVLPVKNYSSELAVYCNTDILILDAVNHILQAVDDTFEMNRPTSPEP